jgi:Family of unknown function (DUF5759)
MSWNVVDAYRVIAEREQAKCACFGTMLERCRAHVKAAVSVGKTDTFFVVPSFVMGVPPFDAGACTRFVREEMQKAGFLVATVFCNMLFISWSLESLECMARAVHAMQQRRLEEEQMMMMQQQQSPLRLTHLRGGGSGANARPSMLPSAAGRIDLSASFGMGQLPPPPPLPPPSALMAYHRIDTGPKCVPPEHEFWMAQQRAAPRYRDEGLAMLDGAGVRRGKFELHM